MHRLIFIALYNVLESFPPVDLFAYSFHMIIECLEQFHDRAIRLSINKEVDRSSPACNRPRDMDRIERDAPNHEGNTWRDQRRIRQKLVQLRSRQYRTLPNPMTR